MADHGREPFARQAWAEAYQELTAPRADLDASDLERLAVVAHLTGRDEESAVAWEAAHRRHVDAGNGAEGARCSFWLALSLMLRGQTARAGGWLSRAESLAAAEEGAAAGYLLVPAVLGALEAGDAATARETAVRTGEIGERLGDRDLLAFGTLGHGQALIALGDTVGGTARLDEVMVSVTAGEVGPITSGIVYCAVILECMQLFDLARAAEWTEALSTWCDAQPDLVPFRGQCLVHRSQVRQAAGDWSEAVRTAEAACQRLADPPHPALGMAHYQQAELHRLRGELDRAAAGYREAARHGRQPVPGLALLDLARGDGEGAAAAVRRALLESMPMPDRLALLAAAVEIFGSIGDGSAARRAATELTDRADSSPSEVLAAMAAQAMGSALLDDGDPSAALSHLRTAVVAWRRLQMPYEGARTAALLGSACAALGDWTSAELELDTARETFRELGARPDLDRLLAVSDGAAGPPRRGSGGESLSAREREVLAHVAAGETNREIAAALTISQHTVGRHLDNIFAKLGVGSRAAATAHAYEHDLL